MIYAEKTAMTDRLETSIRRVFDGIRSYKAGTSRLKLNRQGNLHKLQSLIFEIMVKH